MNRLVRDLSQKQQKNVELLLIGEETEVDKTVIENVADPLVHIIRNSVDHGMETPEERETVGKPRKGTVNLEASHHGGEIRITIRDDGRGLNKEKILARALERELIDGSRELPDREIFELIFHPGFSTKEQVTSLSGRGVGMDVVKRNIQLLRGRVEVDSTEGEGTTITLRIPLTLAIIEGMLVRVGKNIYTIPLLSIVESVTMDKETLTILPSGEELFKLRNHLLPLIRLGDTLGIENAAKNVEDGIVVVVEDGVDHVGLLVDEVIGQRQTVIKALPGYLSHVPGFAGCSILSNGSISLILDITRLAVSVRGTVAEAASA